jgi:hypothetical protein
MIESMDYRGRAAPSAPRESFVARNAGLQGPLFHGGSSRKALFTRTGISETPDLPETIQSALSASNYRKT